MTHEELRDLIPAHALDALGPDDARAVEAHLAGCPECRRDLADLRDVAADLGASVAAVEPPAALRGRILEAVRRYGPVPAPVPARALAPGRWWTGALAAAAALILVLGGVTVYQSERLGRLTALLNRQERLLVLLASPTVRTATLSGSVRANVRFVYDRASRQGVLVVTDLQDPGAGFVYELWLVAGKQPQAAGVFRPVPGQPILVPVTADFSRYQAVAISVEHGPAGSPGGPTTTPILLATI